jgi:hypothetical protein
MLTERIVRNAHPLSQKSQTSQTSLQRREEGEEVNRKSVVN